MYEIDYKNLKKNYPIYFDYLIVSLLIFCIMFWLLILPCFKKYTFDGYVKASNTKINSYRNDEGDTMYSATYEYVVGNETYYCNTFGTVSSSNGLKEKNAIYYDVNNPSTCLTEYDASLNFFKLLMFFFPLLGIYVGINGFNKTRKKIKKIKYLADTGKLIKGLKYELIPSKNEFNDRNIQCIKVMYEINSGVSIPLIGDPRYDLKNSDADGLVDLLIDPLDSNNYYIDFEIKPKL